MHIAILHNSDHDSLEDDPGREAREDVVRVAMELEAALDRSSIEVERVVIRGDSFDFIERLRKNRPTAVINLTESVAADARGEMAVPCLLDALAIPYTGSSGLGLALSLYKNKAKELLVARGVSTPEFRVIEHVEGVVAVDLPFPVIVKPVREDASMGIDFDSVVTDRPSLGRAVAQVVRRFHQPALVERYILGREISVPLLGNQPRRALPLSEIQFGAAFADKPNIVSYRAKWDLDSAECQDSPSGLCALDEALERKLVDTAMAAFDAVDCRDYGRVDMRLSPEGVPYVIDINPNCDLHPESGFAKSAAAAGITYDALALRLVELALERSHGNTSGRRTGSTATVRAVGPNRNLLTSRGGLRPRAHRPRAQAK
jgi:D-alanine-D-alanine ligase